MTNKFIILSGKQFSGKDTVAKILLKKLEGFKRIGIGDAIKIEYGKQKNLTFEEIEANKAQYRPDLIELGNWGRTKSPDYWLDKILELDGNYIIPDVRVCHELEKFQKHGAFTIRVESSKENRAKRGTLVQDDDPTETGLDDVTSWDFVIENNGTYEELLEKTENLIQKINNTF
ncbi:MAG: hypothetical protein PHV68_01125 [Candidatus Gastranaerophilales bacterium]|nr:hypothetical protein [Candidatus Gastranaerophilales bacterium]